MDRCLLIQSFWIGFVLCAHFYSICIVNLQCFKWRLNCSSPLTKECEVWNSVYKFRSLSKASILIWLYILIVRAGRILSYIYSQLGIILEKQGELENDGLLNHFDPECAVFVCNKWEEVSDEEEEAVWNTIAETLESMWPTEEGTNIRKQMYKMSVKTVCMHFNWSLVYNSLTKGNLISTEEY